MFKKYILLLILISVCSFTELVSQWRPYGVPEYLKAEFYEQFPDFYKFPINGKLKFYEAAPEDLKYRPEQTKFLTSDGIEVVNVSSTFPDAKTETWIALNPTNPNNIIATCNDNRYLGGFDGFRMSAFVSNDAGRTWAHKPTPTNKGQWITPLGNQATIFDPGIAFNSKGHAYYIYGFSETTWGSDDKDTEQNGVFIVKSTDGGSSWNGLKNGSDNGIVAITTDAFKTSGNPFHDRYTIGIDATEGSPYKDNIYVTWRVFRGLEGVVFSRSTDGGENWSPYRRLATGGQAPQPITGPNGEIYVTWIDVDGNGYSKAMFMKSTDAGVSFGSPLEAQKVISIGDRHPSSGRFVLNNKQGIRVSSVPQIGVDNSKSAYRGNVYVVQAGRENTGGQYGIYFGKSTNQGSTWTKNIRIDASPIRNDLFFPSISVDPVTGMIAVLYYSSQNDPKNVGVDAYVALSNDGGNTWNNLRVTPNTFYLNSQSTVFPQGGDGNIYWGDYTHVVAFDSRVYPIYWAPTRMTDYNYATTALFTAFISPAPQQPTNTGFLTVTEPTRLKLSWTNPTKNLLGNALGDFKINVYKGENKLGEVAKNQTPEFYDNNVVYGAKYTYYLETETTDGLKSSKAEITATVGGTPKPKAPSDLSWKPAANGVTLTWRNPSQTINDEPLLDDIKIAIYNAKTNQLIEKIGTSEHMAGQISSYTIVMETEKFYELNVKAIGVRESVETESDYSESMVIAYAGAPKADMNETFDVPQSIIPNYVKGKWAITNTKSASAPNSFTDSPDGNYASNTNEYFILAPVVLSSGKSTISFDHIALIDTVIRTDNNGVARHDYGEIAYSNDFGKTWKMLKWVNSNNSPDFASGTWQNLAFNLSELSGDTLLFKFTLASNDFRNGDGWYIDNIKLDGRPTFVDYDLFEMSMISINPNPIKNFAKVSLKTAIDSDMRIEMFDILGNKIISDALGQKAAGEYSFDYNLTNIADGMYYFRISLGNYTKTIAVSVTK